MKRTTVIQTVNGLPKEFDLELLFERLIFMEKVEMGLKDVEEGKVIPHEKVMKMFRKKWSK